MSLEGTRCGNGLYAEVMRLKARIQAAEVAECLVMVDREKSGIYEMVAETDARIKRADEWFKSNQGSLLSRSERLRWRISRARLGRDQKRLHELVMRFDRDAESLRRLYGSLRASCQSVP